MRVKSILPIFVFFFLFNAVSFAQYEGLNLEQIKSLWSGGTEMSTLAEKAAELGYRPTGALNNAKTEFSDGTNTFSLSINENNLPIYTEECETRKKLSWIMSEAKESGMDDLHWPIRQVWAFGDDAFVVVVATAGSGGSITVYPRTLG